MGKEKVHFQAPDSDLVEKEMTRFIDWFNNSKIDLVIKAAIAHLWFVTIHYLIDKVILQKEAAGGRSTNYELKGMPTGNLWSLLSDI